MMRLLLLSLLALAGAWSAPLAAQTRPIPIPPPELRAGDSLYIQVWRKPDLSGGFQIGAGGTIIHPLYRGIRVTGKPVTEVEEQVQEFLLDYDTEPTFVMQPLFRVSVGGYVERPSLYFFDPGVTVPQAIAMAGGATQEGRKDRVRLVRDGQEVVLDLIGDREVLLVSVRSGDQILVDRKPDILRDYLSPVASGVSALGTLFAFLRLVGIV